MFNGIKEFIYGSSREKLDWLEVLRSLPTYSTISIAIGQAQQTCLHPATDPQRFFSGGTELEVRYQTEGDERYFEVYECTQSITGTNLYVSRFRAQSDRPTIYRPDTPVTLFMTPPSMTGYPSGSICFECPVRLFRHYPNKDAPEISKAGAVIATTEGGFFIDKARRNLLFTPMEEPSNALLQVMSSLDSTIQCLCDMRDM